MKGVGGEGVLSDIVAISAGKRHSLALNDDGEVFAWGTNRYGQLGNNSRRTSFVPVQVQGLYGEGNLRNIVAVSAGEKHSLALNSDGEVYAWGGNSNGQVGTGSTRFIYRVPVLVTALTDVVAISAGGNHSLALKNDTVWAWGVNTSGEVGNGSAVYSIKIPVQVTALTDVVAISAGGNHSLALKDDGTVWAWGRGSAGS